MATAADTTTEHAGQIKLTTFEECQMFLRKLNQDLDIATVELQKLESYINNLMKRAVSSRRMGHHGQTISNLIHHSVAKSVQDVYENYIAYKRFQAVWMYNKFHHDLSSDQAFRQAITEINTQLVQNVYRMINENQEEFVPERKITVMSVLTPYHSRQC